MLIDNSNTVGRGMPPEEVSIYACLSPGCVAFVSNPSPNFAKDCQLFIVAVRNAATSDYISIPFRRVRSVSKDLAGFVVIAAH